MPGRSPARGKEGPPFLASVSSGIWRFLMAGKPRYKLEQILESIKGSGGIISACCRRLNCSWDCFDDYRKRYPQIAAALAIEREMLLDFAESQLVSLIKDKNLVSILFFLKCMGKSRGWCERKEVADMTGEPVLNLAERLKQVEAQERERRVSLVRTSKTLPMPAQKEETDES
jgi:hypothetical protein